MSVRDLATAPPRDARLAGLARQRFEASIGAVESFFEAHAREVVLACRDMAGRFEGGGTLLVFGTGAGATDAQHVSVEFVHPVIVGKRALPAVCLANDPGALTGRSRDRGDASFLPLLDALARPGDIALGISASDGTGAVSVALGRAAEMGLLTLALGGGSEPWAGSPSPAHAFVVPSRDPMVVQEVHETLYHVLWELVHLFFEHRGTP